MAPLAFCVNVCVKIIALMRSFYISFSYKVCICVHIVCIFTVQYVVFVDMFSGGSRICEDYYCSTCSKAFYTT